jgi:hypothetical protein
VRALSRDHPIRFVAAERSVNDIKTIVSLFTADGAILDVVSATERGKDLGRMVDVFATAFPDMHRDIHHVYETQRQGDRRDAEHQSCGHSPKVPAKRFRRCAVPASERAVEARRLGVPEQVRDFGNRERRVGEIQFCRPLPCVLAESIEGSSRLRQPTLQRPWSNNEAPRDGIDAHVAGRHLSGKRVPHFISEIGAGRQTGQQIDRAPLEPAAKRRIVTPEWQSQICFRECPLPPF